MYASEALHFDWHPAVRAPTEVGTPRERSGTESRVVQGEDHARFLLERVRKVRAVRIREADDDALCLNALGRPGLQPSGRPLRVVHHRENAAGSRDGIRHPQKEHSIVGLETRVPFFDIQPRRHGSAVVGDAGE